MERKKYMILSANYFKELIENGTIKFESTEINLGRIHSSASQAQSQASQKTAMVTEVQENIKTVPVTAGKGVSIRLTCDECSDTFLNSQRLVRHYKAKHPGVEVPKPHTCSHCGYQTTNSCVLDVHLRMHTKERPFKCPYCERRFTVIGSLNYHVDVFHCDQEHVCEHCPYKTMLVDCKTLLMKCPQKFAVLKKHIRTSHTVQLPHACPRCPRRFERPEDRAYHLQLHEKPFPCSWSNCDRRFTTRAAAELHERALHAGPVRPRPRPATKHL